MANETKLILATEKESAIIHQMKYKAFLPLYDWELFRKNHNVIWRAVQNIAQLFHS